MEEKNDLLKYRTIVLICQELFIAKILPFPINVIFEQKALPFLTGKSKNLSTDFADYADLILKNRCNLYNLWMNPARNW
jgi:hypothetical protein